MAALVGSTGFVGSNIYAGAGGKIDAAYHSRNIAEAFGTEPELLIFAGLRAEKYLANKAPEKDMELILQAEETIAKIRPKKLVLISTIDVFKKPIGVDETAEIDTEGLHAYGLNRYRLEQWVRETCPEALIIRLPGLYGKNIKKNFIYDFINIIPFMLPESKLEALSAEDPDIKRYYKRQNNGFYKVAIADSDRELLKRKFQALDFSALNFTDSRSVYQFYALSRLWDDIQTALRHDIRLWHPATEPVSAAEVYTYLTGGRFVNELEGIPAVYDYRTIHSEIFGGRDGYICGKEDVLRGIKEFVEEHEQEKNGYCGSRRTE